MSSTKIWFDSLTGGNGDKFLTNFLGFDTFVFHADQDRFEKAPEANVEGLGVQIERFGRMCVKPSNDASPKPE